MTPDAYVYTWGAGTMLTNSRCEHRSLEGRRSPNLQADLLLEIGLVFTLAAASLRPVASR